MGSRLNSKSNGNAPGKAGRAMKTQSIRSSENLSVTEEQHFWDIRHNGPKATSLESFGMAPQWIRSRANAAKPRSFWIKRLFTQSRAARLAIPERRLPQRDLCGCWTHT